MGDFSWPFKWFFPWPPTIGGSKRSLGNQVNRCISSWRFLDKTETDMIWSNYSDLTRPHPNWWFSKGNPFISGKLRLVKYYNLPRYDMNREVLIFSIYRFLLTDGIFHTLQVMEIKWGFFGCLRHKKWIIGYIFGTPQGNDHISHLRSLGTYLRNYLQRRYVSFRKRVPMTLKLKQGTFFFKKLWKSGIFLDILRCFGLPNLIFWGTSKKWSFPKWTPERSILSLVGLLHVSHSKFNF